MAESQMTEQLNCRKSNDRNDIRPKDIWTKRSLTENCIKANKKQSERNMANEQLIVLMLHI